MEVDIYDPWANQAEVEHEYELKILAQLNKGTLYDAIILAVSHKEFLSLDISKLMGNNAIVFDTKAFLDRNLIDGRL